MVRVNDHIDKYRLIDKLGGGSFGDVYKAQHTFFTNRIVAIKIMRTTPQNDEERDLFLEEAHFLDALQHPHILSVIDVGTHEGLPYLITEYAANGSLLQRLKRQQGKPFLVEEAVTLLSQIGEALHYAHQQNIVHRDLKPENLLFNAKGEVLIADFGIAKMLSTIGFRQGTTIGTPPYMAPEQFRGTASRESDQYALGCIAYEFLTGQRPFIASDPIALMYKHIHEEPVPPRQLNPSIPIYVEQAVLKALAKEVLTRHPDVAEFIKALHPPQKAKEVWFSEGDAYYEAEHYEEAIIAFEQAIQLDPNYALAYYMMGKAFFSLAHYGDLSDTEKTSASIKPADSGSSESALNDEIEELLTLLGLSDKRFAAKERCYKQALTAFEQTIRLIPDFAFAHYYRGKTLIELKDDTEALVALNHALQLDSTIADAYDRKGSALRHLNRYEEALEACERAIQLDPSTFAHYYQNKRVTLRVLGRYKEAQEAYKQAKQLGYDGE